VNLSQTLLEDIEREVDTQAHALSRVDIVRESVRKSLIVQARSIEEAFVFSNDYAPEHLILHLQNADEKVRLVQNAGSVFVGPFSPERYVDNAALVLEPLFSRRYAVVATMRQGPTTRSPRTAMPDSLAA
jgi:phosphoribosyl-ATP pyrophosphohydrolase / phosphoribosyl-AMP cyclohydrolase / histidinol dehydrogenase